MQALTAVCYVAASLCFLVCVGGPKLKPTSLDFLALGLFLITFPTVIEQVNKYV